MGIKKTNLEGWIVNDWRKVLLKPNDSLEYAIKVLHEGGFRIALVSDKNDMLLGTLTD